MWISEGQYPTSACNVNPKILYYFHYRKKPLNPPDFLSGKSETYYLKKGIVYASLFFHENRVVISGNSYASVHPNKTKQRFSPTNKS